MASYILLAASATFLTVFALYLYIRLNDGRLQHHPPRVAAISKRANAGDVRAMAADLAANPGAKERELTKQIPPKTGRRYIVAGGGGFLGGWIVNQLLERGEDPKKIRVLDINEPVNFVVEDARKKGLQYFKTNVVDSKAVEEAFTAPWDSSSSPNEPGITVFHTIANIRFYERHPAFLPRSTSVNVQGTQNIIAASKLVGASVLVYTSSASIGVKATRPLLWPWETEPRYFVQVINDDDNNLPKEHWEYFSNYAVSKRMAEILVRKADKAPLGETAKGKVLRTGAIRPGNGVFGPRGDMLCGAYLVRQANPTWIGPTLQSFCYVENCALSHLLYERRLLDLVAQDELRSSTATTTTAAANTNNTSLPDIGGQAFCIADPGPAPTYGDAYTTLETLTSGECHFITLSPTLMLFIAYLIEAYHTLQFFLTSPPSSSSLSSFPRLLITLLRPLGRFLKPLQGDIINLQTGIFTLTSVHIIVDDSRARLPPSQGGLGYKGSWNTLEGLWKTWVEFESGVGRSEARSDKAGVGLGMSRRVKVKRETNEVLGDAPLGPVEIATVQ